MIQLEYKDIISLIQMNLYNFSEYSYFINVSVVKDLDSYGITKSKSVRELCIAKNQHYYSMLLSVTIYQSMHSILNSSIIDLVNFEFILIKK